MMTLSKTVVRVLVVAVALLLTSALAPPSNGPVPGVTKAEAQSVWGRRRGSHHRPLHRPRPRPHRAHRVARRVVRRTARHAVRHAARRLYGLPPGYQTLVVANTTYYVVGGVYYVPAMAEGRVVYVEAPTP